MKNIHEIGTLFHIIYIEDALKDPVGYYRRNNNLEQQVVDMIT